MENIHFNKASRTPQMHFQLTLKLPFHFNCSLLYKSISIQFLLLLSTSVICTDIIIYPGIINNPHLTLTSSDILWMTFHKFDTLIVQNPQLKVK